MRFMTALLALFLFVLASTSLSIEADAENGHGYITNIEEWLDREAIPRRHSLASNRSVVAQATPMASGLLVDRHTAAGVPCESCHAASESTTGEQHPPVSIPSFDATCVACHGTMLEAPEGKEMSFPNPHLSPHLPPGEVPLCTECHRVHQPGEVTCNLCHRGFNFTVD